MTKETKAHARKRLEAEAKARKAKKVERADPSRVAEPKVVDAKAENQRATLIVRRVPITKPGQAQKFLVHAVANTLEFTVGQGLSEAQVAQLTKSPDIHVTITA